MTERGEAAANRVPVSHPLTGPAAALAFTEKPDRLDIQMTNHHVHKWTLVPVVSITHYKGVQYMRFHTSNGILLEITERCLFQVKCENRAGQASCCMTINL